jgi:hypothetical protein
MKNLSWITASIAVLAAVIALTALNFTRFPFFLDIYYHLNVMRGFDMAGGVVGRAFWELSPIGQPLLYPPIFHLALLVLYKTGMGILTVARLSSILPVISLFAVIFLVTDKLHSPKRAFFTLLAVCIPYSFFLKMTITVPVTISLIFIVLAFFSLEKRRIAACSILLALVFYTHLALPWMACAAFIIYGLLDKNSRQAAFTCVLFALALAIPEIMNTVSNIDKFAGPLGIPMPEGGMFEIYPLICIFAAIGLMKARDIKDRPVNLFAFSLLAAFLPLAVNYRFRLLSGEGMLPVLFLAGAGMEAAYDRSYGLLKSRKFRAPVLALYTLAFIVGVNFFSPTVSMYVPLEPPYDKKDFSVHMRDSTAANLLPEFKTHVRPFEINLVDDCARKWVKAIEENTSETDIICSNDAFVGSMLSAMSGRANAARLFLEVKEPDVPISEFGSSKIVVWVREYNGKFSSDINKCIEKFGYQVILMDESAVILKKPCGAQIKPVKPLLKTWAALLILSAALSIAFFDIARSR